MPVSRTMIALITPATPLPPSRWPTLAFNAPLEDIPSDPSFPAWYVHKSLKHGRVDLHLHIEWILLRSGFPEYTANSTGFDRITQWRSSSYIVGR